MAIREVIYKMAFTFLKKKIGANYLREFEEKGVDPETFFTIPTKDLITKLGMRQDHDFDKMAREEAVAIARAEWEKIEPHNIQPLFVLDDDYPSQLAETDDPPLILYKLGEADLEAEQMLAVVGTRKPTPYGQEVCNRIIEEVGGYFPEAVIVSGLAYGIDAISHKKALEKGLPTVAVVAHGLNMIYPAANRTLAKEIIKAGGAIVSEHPFGVKPFKQHFLARNRIIAGLSDVTIIVESNIKGGAMSTANYAFLYNRDVAAFPGRSSDELSSGCNLLIRKNKAHLIECAADIIEITGWKPLGIPLNPNNRNLFPEMQGDEKIVYDILKGQTEPLHLDRLAFLSGLSSAKLLSIIGDLEFNGIILRYPGNRFSVG